MHKIDLFLDSGAHSLYTKKVIKEGHAGGYKFFESDEFWKYIDEYALFVKENLDVLSVYVNVDVIFNPELTWKVQKYMEEQHGLSPLPVVHYGTDLKWLKKYMDNYDYIGLGGLGQEVTKQMYFTWADEVYNLLCDFPDRLPRWKTHGFAMTALSLMQRYPWYSVDSTTWVLVGRMGSVHVPKFREGKYDYLVDAWKVTVSDRSPSKGEAGKHFKTFSPAEQEIITEYLDHKGYKIGSSEFRFENKNYKPGEGERWYGPARKDKTREVELVIEPGLSNDYMQRDELNIIYFLDLEKALPKWPWAFKPETTYTTPGGFGL